MEKKIEFCMDEILQITFEEFYNLNDKVDDYIMGS
jgi:hypothetical protein